MPSRRLFRWTVCVIPEMNPFIGQSGFDSFWLQHAFFGGLYPMYLSASHADVLDSGNPNIFDCYITACYKTKPKQPPGFLHHRYIKSDHNITALSSGLNHPLFHSWEVQQSICRRAGNTSGSTRP